MIDFDIKDNDKKVYFIGIGGVSMSALAQYLHSCGFEVAGSDSNTSEITENLRISGIKVYPEHSADNMTDIDLVIYTDAISMDNPELKYAIKEKLDIMDRAEFLGQLMKGFEFSIGVAGTHGKTSTTSMLTEIICDDKSNPTIMLGGYLDKIGGNLKLGDNKVFLTEACEYKGNIEKYYPKLGIILNVDEDHLDYFDSMDHIVDTFKNYANNLSEDDILLINGDDENTPEIVTGTDSTVYTFGLGEKNYYSGRDNGIDDRGYPKYTLFKNDKEYMDIELSVLGSHNIYNSIAAIAAADIYGIAKDDIKSRIEKYTGVHRRLEQIGGYNGIEILDDYAHHPTEIKVTLDAIKNTYKDGKIYCVFQPHTFTRTEMLLDGFASSFNDANQVIIADIFAAREKDYGNIHSKILVKAINKIEEKAIYLEHFWEIEDYLLKHLEPGDCMITMGAGDVYKIGQNVLKKSKLAK